MTPQHHLIYVPGLHDTYPLRRQCIYLVPLVWRLHGFKAHVIFPHWEEGTTFQPKLDRILEKVDNLVSQGHAVSLVGQSAGGGAVLNAFMIRPDTIQGVVNITGRLHTSGEPSLATASKNSPAFAQSVKRCEAGLLKLTKEQRARIMTIRPSYDAAVPAETVAVPGAINHVYSVKGHAKGGAWIAAIQTRKWMAFLREKSI
jgi:hypothetical protein